MSFEFSQNLLADIQSYQQQYQHYISATQTQPSLSSQDGLQTRDIQSENLLANVPLTQHSIQASRSIKFPRPQNGHSLSHQHKLPPRLAYSRFSQAPPLLNVSLANSLKQVQRRLDEFPIQVAKMLEEGFEYLKTESKKHSIERQQSSAELCQVLENIQRATKEKDERVKKALEECAIELKNYSEEIKCQKIVQEKYAEAIRLMKDIIEKQAGEIDHLKKELEATVNVNNQSLKIKSELKDQKPASLLPRVFTSLSQSSSSTSSPECMRQFPAQLDDIMQESESEVEIEIGMEGSSPGLGVDFSELITISDSEEEVMVDEE